MKELSASEIQNISGGISANDAIDFAVMMAGGIFASNLSVELVRNLTGTNNQGLYPLPFALGAYLAYNHVSPYFKSAE